jgi:hypothetical protein
MQREYRTTRFFVISTIAGFIFASCASDSSGPAGPSGSNLQLGPSSVVHTGTVTPAGGITIVRKSGDPLDGLTIDVPAGAFAATQTLTIASAPVQSHQFGPDFQPVTPLFTIDPGSAYAQQPVTITIPAKIPQGYFAMAVAYNATTDQLEPLPILALTDSSITTYLGDFASAPASGSTLTRFGLGKPGGEIGTMLGIIVSIVATQLLDLDSEYPSGFSPGVDDWQFANYGSVLAPGGHCDGQSIAMMWYFNNKFRKGAPALFGRYDNDGQSPATPNLQQDDVLGYTLCSVVQHDGNSNNFITSLSILNQKTPPGDIVTLKMFSYALRLTHSPQLVGLGGYDNGIYQGHTALVYKQSGRQLYVADPNFPGDASRRIRFRNVAFEPYSSGPDAANLGVLYDEIYYVRYQSAIFNWNSVADRWKELENKTIGTGEFPSYSVWVLDDSANFVPMADGFASTGNELTLSIRSSPTLKFQAFSEACVKLTVSGNSVGLPSGKQRVGICIVNSGERWAGFHWYSIEMGKTSTIDTTSIFPLVTGNRWTYFERKFRSNGTQYDTLTYTVAIVGAEFIQNDLWFLMTDSRGADTLCLTRRYDGIWAYPYRTAYPPFRLFAFPASSGESYASGVAGTIQMTVLNTNLTRTGPAGTFTPCYEYKQAYSGTEYNLRYLAPGFGEVESATYSAKEGGGVYMSGSSQLQSYTVRR